MSDDEKIVLASTEIEAETVSEALTPAKSRCLNISGGAQCVLLEGHEGEHIGYDGFGSVKWTDIPYTQSDILDVLKSSQTFQAIANKLMQRSPIMSTAPIRKTQRQTIDVGPITVPPLGIVVEYVVPDCLFRGENIINTGSQEGLVIEGIFVGDRRQFAPNTVWPLRSFAYNGLSRGIKMDTCTADQAITFRVRNTTDKELVFAIKIPGKAIE